jgi:hypothetical protein
MSIKYIQKNEIPFLSNTLGEDFALIENPGYVFPGFEIVPLAKKSKSVENIIAAVMDMDGTTTTK